MARPCLGRGEGSGVIKFLLVPVCSRTVNFLAFKEKERVNDVRFAKKERPTDVRFAAFGENARGEDTFRGSAA